MARRKRKRKFYQIISQITRHYLLRAKILYSAVVLILLLISAVVLYGFWTKRDVQLGPDGVKVTEPYKTNTNTIEKNTNIPKLTGPTEQETNWKEFYEEEIRKNKELEKTLEDLRLQIQRFRNSVWYHLSIIAGELSQTLSIDTNLYSEEDHTKEINRSIQLCLSKIGFYDELIDGDQSRTNKALMKFQEAMGLEADGKFGRQTWEKMIVEIGKKLIRAKLGAKTGLN